MQCRIGGELYALALWLAPSLFSLSEKRVGRVRGQADTTDILSTRRISGWRVFSLPTQRQKFLRSTAGTEADAFSAFREMNARGTGFQTNPAHRLQDRCNLGEGDNQSTISSGGHCEGRPAGCSSRTVDPIHLERHTNIPLYYVEGESKPVA
jgi:hypothetical protein